MKSKSDRKFEAQERQEAYDKLTVAEKIHRLNSKFGKNKGAKKEGCKILEEII